jgi:hypothetical protein
VSVPVFTEEAIESEGRIEKEQAFLTERTESQPIKAIELGEERMAPFALERLCSKMACLPIAFFGSTRYILRGENLMMVAISRPDVDRVNHGY